jgi:predicted metal-dependent HD superfamily phosphohydrolase
MDASNWLRDDWQRLMSAAGLPPAESVRDELLHRYGEAGRFYHNQHHLLQVLTVIHGLEDRASDPCAVLLAAWFHDAVYDSRAKENEARSAVLARRLLPAIGASLAMIERACDLILRTQAHQADGKADAEVLLDADLSILGSAAEEYDRYAAAIRQEYAWVADADYRLGRSKVLEGFLQRDRIYFTPEMHQLSEASARQNLRREIERLAQP